MRVVTHDEGEQTRVADLLQANGVPAVVDAHPQPFGPLLHLHLSQGITQAHQVLFRHVIRRIPQFRSRSARRLF